MSEESSGGVVWSLKGTGRQDVQPSHSDDSFICQGLNPKVQAFDMELMIASAGLSAQTGICKERDDARMWLQIVYTQLCSCGALVG